MADTERCGFGQGQAKGHLVPEKGPSSCLTTRADAEL